MPLSRFQVTTLPELRFLTPLSDGVRSSLKSVSGISTIPTVLLPGYKHRGTQSLCDAHRKRYPTSRIGQSLEEVGSGAGQGKGRAEMPQPFRNLRPAKNRSPHPLVGSQPSLALLIGGASFHIGAAILMRLNTFLWAFVATYPAIIFCAHAVVLPSLLIAEI